MDPRKVFLIELHEIIKNSSEIRNQLVDPSEDNIVWDEFKLSEDEVNALKIIILMMLPYQLLKKRLETLF